MRKTTLLLLLLCGAARAELSVQLFWSGALTSTSIGIRARTSGPTDSIRVAYCMASCNGDYQYSAYASADLAHDLVARFSLSDLLPGTTYTYRFEVDGALDTTAASTGRFRTPTAGPASFSFVLGSCNGFSMHPVWQAMRDLDPLFFLSTGDLHYRDPNSVDIETHYVPYREDVLSWSPMNELLHESPIAFVWDDHDFSGNGSDISSFGRLSAARAYRDYVPHYALNDAVSVHQAFTIGRVHFILTDLRSSKSAGSMMDFGQYTWLLQQFLHARDNGLVAAWVSPLTWNSTGYPENWACQPDERTAIIDFLFSQQVQDLFILSGDAHMLAIDDGANADFSSAQSLAYRYPIFQAGAISRTGSYKGGNFNQGGVFPNPFAWFGQFGEVRVQDDGQEICITFNGYRTDSMSTATTLMNSYTFCRTPAVIDVVPEAPTSALQAWYAQGAGLMVRAIPGSPVTVTVNDSQGRLVKEVRSMATPEKALLALDELPPGLYTAGLVQGDQRNALRFVRTE